MAVAVKSFKDDCANKADISKKYSEEIKKEILDPLKQFIDEQTDKYKKITAIWKMQKKAFEERKIQMEAAQNKYAKGIKDVDDVLTNYYHIRESKDTTEERRNKLKIKITQILKEAKENEKAYKVLVYSSKEVRLDFCKAVVSNITTKIL